MCRKCVVTMARPDIRSRIAEIAQRRNVHLDDVADAVNKDLTDLQDDDEDEEEEDDEDDEEEEED